MAVGDSSDQQSVQRRTMKLCGKMGNVDVLILVDSGIVGTFSSDKLAEKLHCSIQSCPADQFMAVDGSPMVCWTVIPQLKWTVQGQAVDGSPMVCQTTTPQLKWTVQGHVFTSQAGGLARGM